MRNGTVLRALNVGLLTNRGAALANMGLVPRSTPCFEVSNADSDVARLYVYDVIGGWDLDAAEFVQAVHAITAPTIDLHINSPGGFVFDAVSMFEALRTHPATVSARIDGLAASAASLLSMAADPIDAETGGVRIAKGGRMMLHDAMGIAYGNAGDLREYADLLDDLSVDISGFYADRAGGSPEQWRGVMLANNRAGTWYSAAQAVTSGLADRISGQEEPEKDKPEDTTAGTAPSAADHRMSQLIRARARVALGGVK